MPKSASVPDADVIADSEDIDKPTSVLAHVELARTSRMSFVHLLNFNMLIIDSNRREKAGAKCPCTRQ
jgi:hypothetical protein